jgi:putative ABC transport system permease protein
MRLTLPWERYQGEAIAAFFEQLVERVETLPGVGSAAVGSQFPPLSSQGSQFAVESPAVGPGGSLPSALLTQVGDGYFATLGLALRRGRVPDASDGSAGPLVAVVNEEAERVLFGGEEALGKRLGVPQGDGGMSWWEIVGVVESVSNRGLEQAPQPEVFIPLRQNRGGNNQMFLLVRTPLDPRSLLPAVRQAVGELDPEQPVYAIRTLEETFAEQQTTRRVAAWTLGFFAAFALLLAALGIFAVVSYATSERTREIGIRMALGADAGRVRRMVVAEAALPLLGGGIVGIASALLLGRLIAPLLFETSPADPVILLAVVVVFTAAALAASYLPARRASSLDAIAALRHD